VPYSKYIHRLVERDFSDYRNKVSTFFRELRVFFEIPFANVRNAIGHREEQPEHFIGLRVN